MRAGRGLPAASVVYSAGPRTVGSRPQARLAADPRVLASLVPLSYGITLCVKTMELDGVALGAARDEDERSGGKEKVHALLRARRKEVEAALAALPPSP